MKKLLFSYLLLGAFVTSAQQTYTYQFNGNFNEASGNGPALTPICTGQFVSDSLLDYNFYQQVYHFDNNCGLRFVDVGDFLASGSHTIEVYFKMSNLSSWKRVIDFKNRTSDKGCYVYNGQLNFYNIVTSTGTAPFKANEYSHYVITRDAATKRVVMYGDGDKYVSFIDNNDDAVYEANKTINFFQDDLVIPNEAIDGSIAILKIHNYALDSIEVKDAFDNLSGALTSIPLDAIRTIPATLYPNPTTDKMVLSLPSTNPDVYSYKIINMVGKSVIIGNAHAGENTLSINHLAPGSYMLLLHDSKGNSYVQKVLKQ